MALTQTPYFTLHALIIDDMATQQTTLRGQLTMLGIGKVDLASNAEDALRQIKARPYGLVLCDYNLNQKTDGQQFFEFVRDKGLLPADCMFFMITAESGYASVASATEHRPDAYLLKPITATDIEERLKMLMDRRQALHAIHEKLGRNDESGALQECDKALARKDRWTMQVLQLKGQVLLQLGRHEDAKTVYRDALERRPQLVWAQLGLAKAHKAAGQFEEAKHLAYEIIHSQDGEKNVAAYDVVAEALEAQGESEAALWALRDAATVIPSTRRQRLVGESAYRNGDLDTALECFQKVTKATKASVIAQGQDTLWLAQSLVDKGDPAAALAALDEGGQRQRNDPAFDNVATAIRAQAQVKAGNTDAAEKLLQRARETLRKPKADFATIALAKAELMTGHEDQGLKLMERAMSADHENIRVKQMISNALRDTGHEDKIDKLIEAAAAGLQRRVTDAKKLLRDSHIDDALAAIEAALREYPENTGVLFQAAQMNCLSLRLKKELNSVVMERVRLYLSRLEKLMPANDRVTQMQRYYRDTVQALVATATV
jgi:tetratricopeptide (TPR) repeat protein